MSPLKRYISLMKRLAYLDAAGQREAEAARAGGPSCNVRDRAFRRVRLKRKIRAELARLEESKS